MDTRTLVEYIKQTLEFFKERDKTTIELVNEIRGYLKTLTEEENLLRGYQLADRDDTGTIRYFGYVRKDGAWLILKEDITAAVRTRRWAKGDEIKRKTEAERGYATAWSNRVGLAYFLFFEVF